MATKSTTSSKKVVAEYATVSNVTELEKAIARQDKNIYLLAGPTYNLTQPLVAYSGLTLEGEFLPTDNTNSLSDGVMLFYAGTTIEADSTGNVWTVLTIDDVSRGDEFINVTAGVGDTALQAGAILNISGYTYLVTHVEYVEDTAQIYVRDDIQHNGTTETELSFYTDPIKDFTLDTIGMDDDRDSGCLYLYGCLNTEITNVLCTLNNDDSLFMNYCVDLDIDNVSAAGSSAPYIQYCNNFSFINSGEAYKINPKTNVLNIFKSLNGEVSNTRGGRINCNSSYNFEIRNCHDTESGGHSLDNSHFFSVTGCSTNNTADGFNCINSTNFTLTNCNAPSATTPVNLTGASDYQVYGNLWQDKVLHTQDVDYVTGSGPVVGTTWTAHGISPSGMTPDSLLHLQGIEGMDTAVFKISEPITKGGNTVFSCRARGNFNFNNYSNDYAVEIKQYDIEDTVLDMRQYGIGKGIYYTQSSVSDCIEPFFHVYTGQGAGSFSGNFLDFYNNNVQSFTVEASGNIFAGTGHDRVNTGRKATIDGGSTSTSIGELSFVGGGTALSGSGYKSVAIGGTDSEAEGRKSVVIGGNHNTVKQWGKYSGIFCGDHNTINIDANDAWSGYSVIMGGVYNTINRSQLTRGSIIGGQNNTIDGAQYSTTLGGKGLSATNDYQTICGIYNENNTNVYFEVGNGSSDVARSNALTVYNDGAIDAANGFFNVTSTGDVSFGSGGTNDAYLAGTSLEQRIFLWGGTAGGSGVPYLQFEGPGYESGSSFYLYGGGETSDQEVNSCNIKGVNAFNTASTNKTGGTLKLEGGFGSASTSGSGGDVILQGGFGYSGSPIGNVIITGDNFDVDINGDTTANSFTEGMDTVSSATSAITLDLNNGRHFETTLTENITTTNVSNVPSGYTEFTWKINSGAGSFTVSFSVNGASDYFDGGVQPTMSAGASVYDIVRVRTYNGGGDWFWTVDGSNFQTL